METNTNEEIYGYQTVYFTFKFKDDFIDNITKDQYYDWWQDFYEKFEKVQEDFRKLMVQYSWTDFSKSEIYNVQYKDTEDDCIFNIQFKVFLLPSSHLSHYDPDPTEWNAESSEFELKDSKNEEDFKIAVLDFIRKMGINDVEKISKIDYDMLAYNDYHN